jgi:AcrR family transcriptional regulator
MVSTPPRARARILDAARNLFYRQGINNTGIDRVIADAAVAKASLYSCFGSKEALVGAYLKSLRDDFDQALRLRSESGSFTIDLPFDILGEALKKGQFYGCPFINALVEMPESNLVKQEVLAYRESVERFFSQASPNHPELTAQLVLIYDGVFAQCKVSPDVTHVITARKLARALVERAGK